MFIISKRIKWTVSQKSIQSMKYLMYEYIIEYSMYKFICNILVCHGQRYDSLILDRKTNKRIFYSRQAAQLFIIVKMKTR